MDKDKNRKSESPPPPAVGLRRSARLQNRPPQSPPPSEGGTDDPRCRVEVSVGDGVNVSVQSSSKKVSRVKVDFAAGGGDGSLEYGSNESRSRQPLLLENANGGAQIKGPVSPPGMMTRSAAGRSEVRSSGTPKEEEEAHPCLFIESILDVIFKHIVGEPRPRLDPNAATDVQNIRLVCKTWKTSVTRLYRRNRAKTVFDRYDHRGNRNGEMKPLTQFMKTMKASQLIPVQKYSFVGNSFCRNNLKMFREFLLLCGPETVELSIWIDSWDTERIMLNLEDLPALEMKKLKTLTLFVDADHRRHCRQYVCEDVELVKLLGLLLIAATSVQEVWVSVDYSEPDQPQHAQIVEEVSRVIAKRMARTVKSLELILEMTPTAFNILAEMSAKLERVDFRAPSLLEVEHRTMFKFLQSQASSLKELEFWSFDDDDKELSVEFPRLEELVKLQLPQSTVSVTVTPPSHFAETFPKLHYLKMTTENVISTLLSTVKKPSRSLKVLFLAKWNFTCPPPLIKKVAQCFPCLAKLSIGLQEDNQEPMGEVFKYLGTLETLIVYFYNFNRDANWVDSVFSGLSEGDCNEIGRSGDFGAVNLNEFQRLPSILNLQNLQKLKILEYHGIHQVAFTDLTAHFVFLEMDKLREIKLPHSAARLFTPRYLERLRDKLVLR